VKPDTEARTLLIHGGAVHTLDGESGPQEAVVIRDGRIAGVGSKSDMQTLAGSDPELVDVGGAHVMPGLIDSHPHVLHFGVIEAPLVDISNARNHEDIVGRIRKRAEETPLGAWIMTTPVGEAHYFERRSWRDLPERSLPDRAVLDRATAQHPVHIQAWAPRTPNVCAFNTCALNELGINSNSPDRAGNVTIEKDQRGVPTGRLYGPVNIYYSPDPFWLQIVQRIPVIQRDVALPGTQRAISQYNAMGVTCVYEGHCMEVSHIEVYRALRAQNALNLRVLTALDLENSPFPGYTPKSMTEFREALDWARDAEQTEDDRLRYNGVTLSCGGPCWPGFLRMYESYRGPFGETTRGYSFVEEEKCEAAVHYCAEHNVRMNYVAGGYRDHDEFLGFVEPIARQHRIPEKRWLVQHAILITPRQIERYADLNIQITTSVGFAWGKGDLYAERMGEHVLRDLIPLRRMVDAGLDVCCGSDWGPKNMFEQIALATTHELAASGRRNDQTGQPVDRETALAMWTRKSADILGWTGIGSLRPGYWADLIVIDRDPIATDPADLAATQVLRTYLGGDAVHDSGVL